MKNLKKLIAVLAVITLIAFTFSGCQTNMSYTFNLETDDQIKVKLDTTNGEKLSQKDGRFYVKNTDGIETTVGVFYLPEMFDELYYNVDKLEGVEIIDTNYDNNPNYIFYKIVSGTETEWNYLVKPNNSKAGIVICNISSAEEASEIFDLLTFEANIN